MDYMGRGVEKEFSPYRLLCHGFSVPQSTLPCKVHALWRGEVHAYRLCKQDMKAFLCEMMIVAQDVCQALAPHRLHGDTVGQAVLLIETGFVQSQRITERGMTLG